ncbi:MAG: DnaA regulatory inactivator Hda [Gammaproteobacteria bacterium]|nr:DnaA regulatory inactivator Hda [Gammaproteobacteria bacterium]
MSQLALPFPLNQNFTFAAFVAGPNGELVQRLQRLDEGFAQLWICGRPDSGRSHLLHAACHLHATNGRKVAYVPCGGVRPDPEMLEGLNTYDLVALDDVDEWLGVLTLERALMGLYEGMMSARGQLVCVSGLSPNRLCFGLADLGSRMKSAEGFEVQELADADKALVLANQARHRGMDLPDHVLSYWLTRSHRGLSVLLADFDRLDQAAMAEQRRVTVPLIKQVLGI